MIDEIVSDLFEPLGPRDQVVLVELARHRPLLGVVELGVLQQRVEIVIEIVVDELEVQDPVLVIQRTVALSWIESRKLYTDT